jgi:hypothetical protein
MKFNIPAIIHQMWIGPHPKPQIWMDTWKEKNPTWEYKLWTEENIPSLTNALQYDLINELCGKVDIARIEILCKWGGIFLDADLECILPLDDYLRRFHFFASYENEIECPGNIANGIMGSEPGHPILLEMIKAISLLDNINKKPAWKTVGPALLTKTIQHHQIHSSPVKILPSHAFLPKHYNSTEPYKGKGKTYANHFWYSTIKNRDKTDSFAPTPIQLDNGEKEAEKVKKWRGGFKIIVPSFNSVKYLPKTLSSIERQVNKNYEVCVIDDASTLPGQREIILEFCNRNHWKYIFHQKNMGTLKSVIDGIEALTCKDEDVIVQLDGDDRLYSDKVLSTLDKIYSEEDIYLTWGSFITSPPNCVYINYAEDLPADYIEKNLHRTVINIFGPLRTFKYRLFRAIQDEDLRDPITQEYYSVTSDLALFYPMLEMAGSKVRYIPEILYVYNIDNPLNDFKINQMEQIETRISIQNKTIYSRLNL